MQNTNTNKDKTDDSHIFHREMITNLTNKDKTDDSHIFHREMITNLTPG